ncbi:MAG: hypothetical protein O8C63_08790 [Candidatus Methanoperedens sp.]|nr:hypothetical protein [Candidatus Methanoperedens sp.]
MEINCSLHKNRPALIRYGSPAQCNDCGNFICHECSIEEILSTRTTAFTSVDQKIELDYGYFCPSCYISLSRKRGYNKEARFLYNPSILRNGIFIILSLVFLFFAYGVLTSVYFSSNSFQNVFSVMIAAVFPGIGIVLYWKFDYLPYKTRNDNFKRAQEVLKIR